MTCKSLLLGRDSIIGFMVFKVKFKLSKVYLLKVVKQFIKLSHKNTMKSFMACFKCSTYHSRRRSCPFLIGFIDHTCFNDFYITCKLHVLYVFEILMPDFFWQEIWLSV